MKNRYRYFIQVAADHLGANHKTMAAYYAGRADQMRLARDKEWRDLGAGPQARLGKILNDILEELGLD